MSEKISLDSSVSFSLGGIDLFTGVKRSYHPREKIVSQR